MERSHALTGAAPRLRSNARVYVPPAVIELLEDIAISPELAVVIDVDALERSSLARLDRVMRLALDALVQVNVQVILLVRHERGRAELLRREIPTARLVHERTLADVRELVAPAVLLGISDDAALLAQLDDDDRGIALGTGGGVASGNIAVVGDLSVRAALWWLVDTRHKEGIVDWASH